MEEYIEPCPDVWKLVCQGERGGEACWEDGFDDIRAVQQMLASLEDYWDKSTINWKRIIGKHSYFSCIEKLYYPPFYEPYDLQELEDFLSISWEPESEMPGLSYTPFETYIARDTEEKVLGIFRSFRKHLERLLEKKGMV